MSPSVVSRVAVYDVAGSMHIGGACSNAVVRSADPSDGGQGVSPVMLAPGPGSTTFSPVGALVSGLSVALAVLVSSSGRRRRRR